jgi:hypothetical protein
MRGVTARSAFATFALAGDRLAQAGEARRPTSSAPIVGLALGGPTGMVGAYLGAAIGAEVRDARERPPGLDRYSECLRNRGYDVDSPERARSAPVPRSPTCSSGRTDP